MIKKFLVCMLLIFLLTGCNSKEYVTAYNNQGYTYSDLEELKEHLIEYQNNMNAAYQMKEFAIQLNNSAAIKIAEEEYNKAYNNYNNHKIIYDDLSERWSKKVTEYPTAVYVWSYLQSLGYNDYICAGILGNMMQECGGETLELQYDIYDKTKSYYGLCQWSNKYYPDIQDTSLEEQCNYLKDNIEKEFNTYGYKYKKKFEYKDFLAITNAEDAALAFLKCYERGSMASSKKRKNNAIEAYNYFVE